jgi:hypothetical protein
MLLVAPAGVAAVATALIASRIIWIKITAQPLPRDYTAAQAPRAR